jgi:hypothetical protein
VFKHVAFTPQNNIVYFCINIIKQMAYKAIIIGASGLIGSTLLDILLTQPEYTEVFVLVRKEIAVKHKKLTQLVVDFDKLDDYADVITGHAIFCCLGTTKKNTPDKNTYRKIDHDYPVKLAQIGAKNGVEQFHIVTALGADPNSSIAYPKLKGETEEDVKKSGIKSIYIYQPSMITGDRKENRPLEKIITVIMRVIDPLLIGSLKKYRSIPAKTIAMAMFKQSLTNNEGIFAYPSDKIKQIA